MKIPKKLLIGDNEWTIILLKRIPNESADVHGLCDPSIHTIFIRTKLSFEDRLNALVHEIGHAISWEGDFYDIPHKYIYKLADGFTKLYLSNIF